MTIPSPTVVIDTREQTPLEFTLPTIRAGLYSGDYSIAGAESLFAIERKSIDDLVGCCMGASRARFERELARLRGYRFARLLVVGTVDDIICHGYRSAILPTAVLHTLYAFEARYIPVVWAAGKSEAASKIETWARWFSREVLLVGEAITKSSRANENDTEY